MDDEIADIHNMEEDEEEFSQNSPSTNHSGTRSSESSGLSTVKRKKLLEPIVYFFCRAKNFDSMPISSKVIVFDIDIKVKDAFQVASENDISFASLWDSKNGELVGMLTVTDLIAILLHYHNRTSVIKDLIAKESVRKWREIGGRLRKRKLVNVLPEDTLWNSIYLLKKFKIHRLPVITKNGALLHIITHSHLLAYLCNFLSIDALPIFNYNLAELNIGTYHNVITSKNSDSVYMVMELFSQHGVSAVPIVDDEGVVVDVYSRYDIVYLVRNGDYSLNCTIEEALKTRPKSTIFTCTKNETLGTVVRHLSKSRIHRLVIVDDQNHILGIVSVSDIFSFFVQNADKSLIPSGDDLENADYEEIEIDDA